MKTSAIFFAYNVITRYCIALGERSPLLLNARKFIKPIIYHLSESSSSFCFRLSRRDPRCVILTNVTKEENGVKGKISWLARRAVFFINRIVSRICFVWIFRFSKQSSSRLRFDCTDDDLSSFISWRSRPRLLVRCMITFKIFVSNKYLISSSQNNYFSL